MSVDHALRIHCFPLSRDAEGKICASIVDTVLTRVAAEERADGNRRRRRRAEGELEKRHRRRAVEAERQGASGEGRVVRML